MANETYKNALSRKINIFKKDFFEFSRAQYTKDGKLIHPGEFGSSREDICLNLIKSIIPKSKQIDSRGFVLNNKGDISKEQDLIFYSKNDTPILTLENTKFFPVETVIGIGQIKSVIRNKKELKEILDNLIKIKLLRENMGHTSVIWRAHQLTNGKDSYSASNAYDQIFTFLICEKIDFRISAQEINELYDKDLPNHLKHNMILDLSNGLYRYQIKAGEPFIAIPYTIKGISIPSFVGVLDDSHIKYFLTNIHIHTSSHTIYHPDMALYLK